MTMTKTDQLILESYSNMLDGLASFLGPGYEFILHSMENERKAAIRIINGYYSNREHDVEVPLETLEKLMEIESRNGGQKFETFFSRNSHGALIKSSIISIAGTRNKTIGFLEINFYMDTPYSAILGSLNPKEALYSKDNTTTDIDNMVYYSVESARTQLAAKTTITSTNRNKEIIGILYDKGVFNVKDAVLKVAEMLGISKNTVYMHLRNIEGSSKSKKIKTE